MTPAVSMALAAGRIFPSARLDSVVIIEMKVCWQIAMV